MLSTSAIKATYFIDKAGWEHVIAARLATGQSETTSQSHVGMLLRKRATTHVISQFHSPASDRGCRRPIGFAATLPRRRKSLRSLHHIRNANAEDRSQRPAPLSRHDADEVFDSCKRSDRNLSRVLGRTLQHATVRVGATPLRHLHNNRLT